MGKLIYIFPFKYLKQKITCNAKQLKRYSKKTVKNTVIMLIHDKNIFELACPVTRNKKKHC